MGIPFLKRFEYIGCVMIDQICQLNLIVPPVIFIVINYFCTSLFTERSQKEVIFLKELIDRDRLLAEKVIV